MLFGPTLAAQPLDVDWFYRSSANGTSESLVDLAVGADERSVATGELIRRFDFQNSDVLTVAVDRQGNELWSDRYIGSANGADRGLPVALGPDGATYVAAQSDGGPSSLDILTLKYSATAERNVNA